MFTLIGGGELVAGASFGFASGWIGTSLFWGYAFAFIVLAIIGPSLKRRSSATAVTYVDFAIAEFGAGIGRTVLLFQLVAFFAVLVLQFAAGGVLLSKLLGCTYIEAIILCALVITCYLFVGGFRAVATTDVIQGLVMLLIIVLAVYVLSKTTYATTPKFEATSFEASWGVAISGLIIGLASADVFQRIYAAKDTRAVRIGFVAGGVMMFVYGTLIVAIGILARMNNFTTDANEAFISVFSSALPVWVASLAMLAVVAAVLSTADTELFLVTTLLDRYILPGRPDRKQTEPFRAWLLLPVAVSAVFAAYFADNLAAFFSWLFVSYMVVAPTIALTLFLRPSARLIYVSFFVSALCFLIGLITGLLTLENSFVLAVPAILVLPIGHVIRRREER